MTVLAVFVLYITGQKPVVHRQPMIPPLHNERPSIASLQPQTNKSGVSNKSSPTTLSPSTTIDSNTPPPSVVNDHLSTDKTEEATDLYTELSEISPTGSSEQKPISTDYIETGETPTHGTSGMGYWVGLHFSDQGTGSFINLMSFLCLSTAVGGVRVVEPFMVGSNVGQNASANWTEEVSFSDIFNSDEFHRFAKSKGYSLLVPYSTFLQDAPRKLLVAQYKCTGFHVCRTCGHEDTLEQGRMFAKLNGFEMVGHVCLDYGSKGLLTLSEFKSQLYHKYSKSEVVVVFPIFGGVAQAEGFRLNMKSNCQRPNVWGCTSHIRPSTFVTRSASNYVQSSFGGSPYISVMVRFQMVLGSKANLASNAETCLDHLHTKVEKLKSQYDIEHVALCLDVGKYGSVYYRRDKNAMNTILPYVNKFISQTVKDGMDLTEWENTYTNRTLRQNPGFVAVMQKTIAARGDVLVLLGGASAYQQSTETMYRSLHKNPHVVKLGNSCW